MDYHSFYMYVMLNIQFLCINTVFALKTCKFCKKMEFEANLVPKLKKNLFLQISKNLDSQLKFYFVQVAYICVLHPILAEHFVYLQLEKVQPTLVYEVSMQHNTGVALT